MIFGIGVDIAEIARIEKDLQRFGERFERRVFSEEERHYCRDSSRPGEHFAARFAAKEAFLKALGTGRSQRIGWQQVAVSRSASGKPELKVTGRARELLDSHAIHGLHLSLSHSENYAVAVVVLER